MTPDGHLVTGSSDASIKLFDMRSSGECVVKAKANAGVICGESAQNLVVTGGSDGNVYCFDVTQGLKCVWGFGADEVTVHCMRLMPDLRSLITGGDKGLALKINLM